MFGDINIGQIDPIKTQTLCVFGDLITFSKL